MRLPFTKMQGAGNDFVVLDGTHGAIELTAAQLRRLGILEHVLAFSNPSCNPSCSGGLRMREATTVCSESGRPCARMAGN